ncbi:MAG: branched-chain amino acid aminotransferase, partial [Clostridia bacterium]|nr:branched-chain amino acid aminotransferase [Clostridia bacterium]
PAHLGLLKGITRDTVMELAEERGVVVKEEVFTRYEVYTADECFLTGTAAEVIPVVKVDGRRIGGGEPGALTKKLIDDYRELTKSDGPKIFDD